MHIALKNSLKAVTLFPAQDQAAPHRKPLCPRHSGREFRNELGGIFRRKLTVREQRRNRLSRFRIGMPEQLFIARPALAQKAKKEIPVQDKKSGHGVTQCTPAEQLPRLTAQQLLPFFLFILHVLPSDAVCSDSSIISYSGLSNKQRRGSAFLRRPFCHC